MPQLTRPCTDIGRAFRDARLDSGWTQRELAKLCHMRQAQISRLENGHNTESQFYARAARALGFRTVSELLRRPAPLTRRLLRLWDAMDDTTQRAAFGKLKVWLLED